MKSLIRSFAMLLAIVPVISMAQVERMEPPNWWTGMEHPELQVMLYGDNLADYQVKIDHPGVKHVSTALTTNPNYLFLNLELSDDLEPGNIPIHLKQEDIMKVQVNFPIKERNPGSAMRNGFDNSDVMYLLMPDRFANGDPSNDIVEGMRENVLDRSDKTGRHGGDLKGIMDHLDYISDMGFTAIWFNPFLENDVDRSSYHGYSTTDFYKVDPRYGSNAEFRELVKMADKKGIKVIMDMIFNHIGITHWWMEDPPSADWINYSGEYVQTNHRRTVNQDPYASEADRRLMVDGWFVRSMPDLNQNNEFLASYLIQNSIWWIEYAGLAGIRMDTYPYPEKEMMAEWNRRVMLEYPNFNIVGEEWSMNPGLVSYWQKGQSNMDGYDGLIPSMMDFPLQNALSKSLNEKESWGTGWITLYEALANDFMYPDPFNLVIFPDNHDMPRFFMQVGQDVDLYKLGIIYILTTRGIPQIFYGSEILMTHEESDHHGHIRKDFPGGWEGDKVNAFTGEGLSKESREMQEFFRKLLNWRKSAEIIHTGKLIHYAPEDGVYVYGRYNKEQRVMILLNKEDKKKSLDVGRFEELMGNFETGTDVITGTSYSLTKEITVPPLKGLILELE